MCLSACLPPGRRERWACLFASPLPPGVNKSPHRPAGGETAWWILLPLGPGCPGTTPRKEGTRAPARQGRRPQEVSLQHSLCPIRCEALVTRGRSPALPSRSSRPPEGWGCRVNRYETDLLQTTLGQGCQQQHPPRDIRGGVSASLAGGQVNTWSHPFFYR